MTTDNVPSAISVPDEVINPVQIEHGIRDCANRIGKGVRVCSDRYAAFLKADHEYDLACARAYINATGTVKEKEAEVEIETEDERRARDTADALYRYADRQAKALDNELRAWQSLNASFRSMYAVSGRREGA